MENNYEKRVGFGPRFGAKLIDTVFIWILAMFVVGPVVATIAGAGASTLGSDEYEQAGAAIGGFLAGYILSFPITVMLYTLIEAFTGASPAKMVLGLKVGKEDGSSGETSDYLKRWAIYNSGSICTVIALLGLAFMSTIGMICSLVIFIGCFFVFGDAKQGLHGKWSQTAIFNKSDLV